LPGVHHSIRGCRKIAVGDPLAVGAEIGDGALDFDNHEIAGFAEGENIGAPAVGEREFH